MKNSIILKMKNFSRKSSPSISASKPSDVSSTTDNVRTTVFGCVSVAPASSKARRLHMYQMICFPFIPILALFIQNLIIFLQQIQTYDEARFVNQQVNSIYSKEKAFRNLKVFFFTFPKQISLTVNVSRLLSAIQRERSSSIYYLLTKENKYVIYFLTLFCLKKTTSFV